MGKTLGAVLALCIATAGAAGCSQQASAQGRVFHVDYQSGNDDRSGLGPGEAWKHAPGDPSATGGPADTDLGPGDRVVFAAGVRYRGNIIVDGSGTEAAPIVFEGGTGAPAVIDGSDPVQVTPCASAPMCGGAENWQDLVLLNGGPDLGGATVFFTDAGSLRSAQEPDPASDFYRHEPSDMVDADGRQLATGRAHLPDELRAAAVPGGSLALWVKPNIVLERPITRIEGDTALFDPAGIQFYDDRPSKLAVVQSIPAIDQPGEYAVLPGTRTAVAMLPEGVTTVSVGSGRGGFTLSGASHVTIRNLAFANMADGGDQWGGIAIFSNRPGNRGISVANNQFVNMAMSRGQGPIILRGVSDVSVTDNTIRDIVFGSGMRITGPAEHALVSGNRIQRVGRTAIMFMGITYALITHNVIDDVRGVHGNGLSAYLGNRNVSFVENTVIDAKQPATFKGGGKGQTGPNGLAFVRNVLVGSPGSLGSLMSWGGNTRDVRIEGNLVVGGKNGMRLNGGDTGVVVERNIGIEPLFVGGQARDMVMESNRWVARPDRIQRMITETITPLEQPSEAAREIISIACPPTAEDGAPSPRLGAALRC